MTAKNNKLRTGITILTLFLLFIFINAAYILYPYRNVSGVKLSSCTWVGHETEIPKVVHRIWFHGELPDKYKYYVANCEKLNPTWTEKLWNETEIVDFLQTYYSWSLNLYYNYPSHNLKSDLARYLILYHYGGMYLDTDVACTATYENILKLSTQADVFVGRAWPLGISNNFIMTKKEHPFFHQLASNLHRARNESYFMPYFRSLMIAGTIYVHKNYINYPCKDQIYIIPEHQHKRGWLLHDGSGSWQRKDGKLLLSVALKFREYCMNPIAFCIFVSVLAFAYIFWRTFKKQSNVK